MDYWKRKERRKKSEQLNMRVSKIDAENMALVLEHMNKDIKGSYGRFTKSEALREGLELYMTKHKLKKVTE